jgi:hypothetical protein
MKVELLLIDAVLSLVYFRQWALSASSGGARAAS